ncbi:MAG: hypothetical protein AAGA64_04515 [Bacteroidota bacterium]
MKCNTKPSRILVVLTVAFLIAACGTTKQTVTNVTLRAPSRNDSQIINNSLINLRSVGYGNTEEDAKYDAMRRAVDMVLFQGIADHDSPVKDGLISNPERAKETHKSFFKNFYGQREYMSFIPNSVLVSSGKKAKGIKPVTVNMSVNVRALRKRLEREGIVRKFGL